MSMKISVEIQRRLAESEAYNYWIYKNISPFVKNRILDIGCSIGNITKFFLDKELVIGLDTCDEAIRVISGNFKEHKNFKVFNGGVTEDKVIALAGEGIDTVLCINVLEHVEDDLKALGNIHSVLMENGRLIIMAPAIKGLYGSMDEADNHFRRYSKRELNKKLADSMFYIEKQFYMNFLGIICWYIDGKILKKKLIPMSHYSLYDRLVPGISGIERLIRPFIGLSLVTVCGKKQEK